MTTATERAAMVDAMASLWKRFATLWAHVNSSAFPAGGTRQSALLALDVDRKSLEWLDYQKSHPDSEDFKGYQTWVSFAKETHEHMSKVAGFTDRWNFTGFTGAIIDDAQEKISNGLDILGDYAPYVLAIVGLIAVAVIFGYGAKIVGAVKG